MSQGLNFYTPLIIIGFILIVWVWFYSFPHKVSYKFSFLVGYFVSQDRDAVAYPGVVLTNLPKEEIRTAQVRFDRVDINNRISLDIFYS
ncbi:hypothetical protein ES703_31469 [subsurface metagenome]